MAFKQLSTLSFIADTIEDLQNIPKDRRVLGTECFVIENSKEYKCNSKGEWKVFSKSISIENGVNIGGGSISNPNYYGGVDGNGCSCGQADWGEVDSSKQSYIRNKGLYSNKKVFSTQRLKITEPFMTITREELGWPEDFFNYSNGKSNHYDVNKSQDLLENWCYEKVLEYCYLNNYQDENERTIYYLGDGWDFENSKIFLMYYYEDEPENIYIKTNRRGYFDINNVYRDSSNQLLRQEPEWFQSDWNDNDTNSQFYIKNKPFYDQGAIERYQDMITINPSEENIIKTTFSLNEYNFSEIFSEWAKEYHCDYIKIIKTHQDGTTQEFLYDINTSNDDPDNLLIDKYVKWIGDFPSIFGYEIDDINHFCLYYLPDEDINTLYFEGEAGTYEFYIYREEYIQKIDERFLPDAQQTQSDWNEGDENSSSFIKNKPFYKTDSYTSNWCSKELKENQSFYRTEEFNWFMNPNEDPWNMIGIGSELTDHVYTIFDVNGQWSDAIENYVLYYIGDQPNSEETQYGFSFYVETENPNIIHYVGPPLQWSFEQYHPEEIKTLDRDILPSVLVDWNETNSNSSRYIGNKPIYVDKTILSTIELNVSAENGRNQTFSRSEYNLRNFLTEEVHHYNIYLYDQNNNEIYSSKYQEKRTEWNYNSETEQEESVYILDGPGFKLWSWKNNPDLIYYSGVRFGRFQFEEMNIFREFLSDDKYQLLNDRIQANWNQENETSYNYIQNKPFYEIPGYDQYADMIDTSLGNEFSKEEYSLYDFLNPISEDKNNIKIISKNTGVEYTFHMQTSYEWLDWVDANQNYNKYCVWYGDMPKEIGDLTGCGFSFYCYPDENPNIIYYEGPEDIYTINYYKEGHIRKIDERFLPSRSQSNWNATDPEDERYILNKPFYENQEYETNHSDKDLGENQSFGRTEEFDWFLNPNRETYMTINCYADVFGEWIKLPVQSIFYGAEDLYYIGDVPSIANSGEENNYGFSFYVSPSNPDVIRYEGPASYWSFSKYHSYELKQIDKKFIPTIALNDLLPEPVNTYELEGITLTLAETLNSLIAALENKHIIVE